MTVTGTFLDATGAARASTAVKFLPESNPQADSLGILTRKTISTTTNGSGAISVVLEQGIYLVVVAHVQGDRFRILVPESSGSADITTLLIINAPTSPVYVPAWFIPASGDNYQYNAGPFQLKNSTTGLYHTIWIAGAAGEEQIQIDQPGVGPIVAAGLLPQAGTNYRLKDGAMQFKNVDTNLFHTLEIVGAIGFEQLQIGAGEA